jgi:hypothetical protein
MFTSVCVPAMITTLPADRTVDAVVRSEVIGRERDDARNSAIATIPVLAPAEIVIAQNPSTRLGVICQGAKLVVHLRMTVGNGY